VLDVGAAVPLPERVGSVDLGEVVGEAVQSRLATEPSKMILGGQLAQNVREVRLDVLRDGEQVALGDRDRADLACPLVDVAEDLAGERLQVRQIVGAGEPPLFQDRQAARGEVGLKAGEFAAVADSVRLRRVLVPG